MPLSWATPLSLKQMWSPADDSPERTSDVSLVERCLRGEPGAERELFRSQFARVNATLFRVLGSNRETEDLIQDAFLEVFCSLRTFEARSRLSTWIDRITV